MIINHNIAALNTHRQMGQAQSAQMESMEKLSSGMRINSAKDDAAGLTISEKMRGQIRGLEQGSRNAQDGISLIQTAEGALSETHDMLQRVRELAVQGNNGTNTADDLTEIQKEITQLTEEIDRVANKTEFNTKPLLQGSLGVQVADGTKTVADFDASGVTLDVSGVQSGETLTFSLDADNNKVTVTGTNSGIAQTLDIDPEAIEAGTTLNFDSLGFKMSFAADTDLLTDVGGGTLESGTIATTGSSVALQIGANQDSVLNISIGDMRTSSLGKGTAVSSDVANIKAVNVTAAGAGFDKNIQVIDEAIKQVSGQRSTLGSWQNRLEHTITNLNTSSENLTAAESRIRDVDYAEAA